MRIDILTALPHLCTGPLDGSIVGRARAKGIAEVHVHDLKDYSPDQRHRKTDDAPYGGGPGMVQTAPPIANCIRALQAQRSYDEVIYLTPDGVPLTQDLANALSLRRNLILLAGHYKGVDQRVRDVFVTREVSIGDYVLSGGELPAMVLADAIIRLLPGAIGDETSALSDSFQGGLLDAPVYTRPADWEGHRVPDVLLSGHEAQIAAWRDAQSLDKTRQRRPDLLPPGT